MRKVAFLVGYGLLPFWGAIAVVFIGSLFSGSNEYWAVAPWLIVVSIPMCAATLVAGTITLTVHARVGGDDSRRRRIAAKTFWGLNAVLVAIAGAWWLRSVGLEREINNEEKAAQDFVRSHSAVVQQFGDHVEVSVASYTTGAGGTLPQRYDIAIDTKRPRDTTPDSPYVFAIVSVKGSSGERQFVLDCITPTSLGHRDPFKDPCKQ